MSEAKVFEGVDWANGSDRGFHVVSIGPDPTPETVQAFRDAYDLGCAWAAAQAALPLVGWPDPMDGRWVIPSGTWTIDIRRAESGDGYFEPVEEGYWATAKVDAYPRPFAIRGDLGPRPADALRSLADRIVATMVANAEAPSTT